MTTTVNNEVRQSATTADMMFSPAQIISYLSQVMSLQAGSVIATGTPAGIGHTRVPPQYLSAGDVTAVEISGVGRIANRVVPERIERSFHRN